MKTPFYRATEAAGWLRRKITKEPSKTRIERYLVDAKVARASTDYEFGELADLFFESDRFQVHKWLHYLEIYERHFAKYRKTDFKMLEIGVSRGGSLDLWRRYFGADATIYGIDINPDCADRVEEPNQVRIGSQADPAFLQSVVDETGPLDVILDDGSHVSSHQQASFATLFPLLKDGGLYVIEDIHTAYYRNFEGGYGRAGTAVDMIKQAIDDLHQPYHIHGAQLTLGDHIGAVHAYDSVAVFEKRKPRQPAHTEVWPK